jgi:Cysteine dioxygenase type I
MTLISDALATQGSRLGIGPARPRLSRARLAQIVASTAAEPGRWRDLVRYDPARRWYFRMDLTDEYEVWLLSWEPGQGTGFHDHGGSRGAFCVALGELEEQSVPGTREVVKRTVGTGQTRSFGARFIHHVVNNSVLPAVSVHAYSPPLPDMRRYELTGSGLRYLGTEPGEVS